MTVGETILQQLGGRKFVVMTGVKDLIQGNNWIMMRLPKNHSKANRLKVSLNGNDLYDMEFIKYRLPYFNKRCEFVPEVNETIQKYDDIFCDQLQELFTETTWLYTHL